MLLTNAIIGNFIVSCLADTTFLKITLPQYIHPTNTKRNLIDYILLTTEVARTLLPK